MRSTRWLTRVRSSKIAWRNNQGAADAAGVGVAVTGGPGRVGRRFFARSSLALGAEADAAGVAAGVARGGGGVRLGISRGIGVRTVSVIGGVATGVGGIVRGGGVARFTGVKVGNGFAIDSAGLVTGVALGTGVFANGEGILRGDCGLRSAVAGDTDGRSSRVTLSMLRCSAQPSPARPLQKSRSQR